MQKNTNHIHHKLSNTNQQTINYKFFKIFHTKTSCHITQKSFIKTDRLTPVLPHITFHVKLFIQWIGYELRYKCHMPWICRWNNRKLIHTINRQSQYGSYLGVRCGNQRLYFSLTNQTGQKSICMSSRCVSGRYFKSVEFRLDRFRTKMIVCTGKVTKAQPKAIIG